MVCKGYNYIRIFVTLILLSRPCFAAWWRFSSDKEDEQTTINQNPQSLSKSVGAEFAVKALDNDERAIELIKTTELAMHSSKSCSQNAYEGLSVGCSKIVADEELKYKLAWDLTDCFQQYTGRPTFPRCDTRKGMMKQCLKKLETDPHKVFLEFFLQIHTICHQLQVHAFKHQTERLVNELKRSAEYAEEKLETINERGKIALDNSIEIHYSLSSIDVRTQQLAETSKNISDHVSIVKEYSEVVYEQSKAIAASQMELSDSQKKMKTKMDEGMAMLHDSYENLGTEINNLKDETFEIEKEIGKVGEAMSLKMENLQNKADDIENMAVNSLDKQKELLNGQSTALEGLQQLSNFQTQALKESRDALQYLAEFGKKQQDELLRRQEQLQQAHDHLVENSKSILAAQEAFESKQANMFVAIDKLFALHSALLLESRAIKSFIFYSLLAVILYTFTSMKQTYNVRPRIYIGLCVTFFTELIILRFSGYDIQEHATLISVLRTLFTVLSAVQLVYSSLTYRDYEKLNHQMLLTINETINGMMLRDKQRYSDMEEEDSEGNWSSWIDVDVKDDADNLDDPDYLLAEEVGENSVETNSITKRYNLRQRRR